jgi:hypothetical protein
MGYGVMLKKCPVEDYRPIITLNKSKYMGSRRSLFMYTPRLMIFYTVLGESELPPYPFKFWAGYKLHLWLFLFFFMALPKIRVIIIIHRNHGKYLCSWSSAGPGWSISTQCFFLNV